MNSLNRSADTIEELISTIIKHQVFQKDINDIFNLFENHKKEEFLESMYSLLRRVTVLLEDVNSISDSLSPDIQFLRLMDIVTEVLDADRSTLFLYDYDTDELFSRVAQGEAMGEIRIPSDSGIAGAVFKKGISEIIKEPYKDERFNRKVDHDTGYVTKNILCSPIRDSFGSVIGVAQVLNKKSGGFTHEDVALLDALMVRVTRALQKAILYEKINKEHIKEVKISKSKTRFLANMSHELRTPLNAIIGFSEMMENEHLGPIDSNYKQYASDINKSGKHLLSIVSDVLSITKIEEEDFQPKKEPCSITEMIYSSIREHKEFAGQRNISIRMKAEGIAAPNVITDKEVLKEIFNNLISNAVKFSLENSEITVKTNLQNNGWFNISFVDKGIGIDEESLKNITIPFNRAGAAEHHDIKGTGLGLALVAKYSEILGCKLEIESKKDEGTTVSILFPPELCLLNG